MGSADADTVIGDPEDDTASLTGDDDPACTAGEAPAAEAPVGNPDGNTGQATSTAGRGRRWLAVSGQRLAILYGLAGIAVTQPVLDLFGRSPEFFVAGRHTGTNVVWFLVLVVLVPALVAMLPTALAELVHPRAGQVLFSAAVAGFGLLFGLVLANAVNLDVAVVLAPLAVGVAAVLVALERRLPTARTFLMYLALGNLVFVAQFWGSDSGDLLSGPSAAAAAELGWVAGELDGPVVVVVADEMPLPTLLDGGGQVNAERYPNIARLAGESSWFRNASSHSPMTHMAMPALLTGMMADGDALPTYEDYPRNFFTMFGDTYPVEGYESVTHLCPDALCGMGDRGDLDTMLRDAGVVYGHQVLPDELADRLPAIDHTWGNFGSHDEPDGAAGGSGDDTSSVDPAITDDDPYGRWHAMDMSDTSPRNQIRILERMVSDVDAEPALHLAHVAVPHYPWALTPGGELTQTLWLDRDPPDPDHERLADHALQLQSLQLGAVDRVVGELIDRLQEVDAWEQATVVLVSDHGRGMGPSPDFGRALTDGNQEELLRLPLFIKQPGQEEGEVIDEPATLVDVVPTLLDVLGAEPDDGDIGAVFDGRSLFSDEAAEVAPTVSPEVDPLLDLAERNARRFPHGDDWTGLAALGDHAALVGSAVDDHEEGAPAEGLSLGFADADDFDDLPVDGNRWPQLLVAELSGSDSPPPELVVAVNGTVAGALSAYEHNDSSWTMVGVTAPLFVEGANEVEAYVVDGRDAAEGAATLQPVPEN